MADHDAVIVGSGINSLVCAALLAKKGMSVCLIERNDRLGGTIRTEEITRPGFHHDLMSCWYPLFVAGPAYGALKDDLHARGLEFCFPARPSGVIRPDNSFLAVHADRAATAAAFESAAPGDGARYLADMQALEPDLDFIFTLLGGQLWSAGMAGRLAKEVWKRKPSGAAAFIGDAMRTARGWLDTQYNSDLVKAMYAPWVLHTGLGPDSALSGLMGRVIAFTLEQVGMPVVKGGSGNLARIFGELIEANGGTIMLNSHVSEVVVDASRTARAVRLSSGDEISAANAVICNVPPPVLYGSMLKPDLVPKTTAKRAADYRFGRAGMQIHFALSRPAQWIAEELDQVAGIHLTPGLDGVSQAVAQADAGLLPAQATLMAGQPAMVDPSRVPDGCGQLWIQLQELPRVLKGDAAGEIEVPADGAWTQGVAEAYADRITERLAAHIPDLKDTILDRKVISPAGLEALNSNLVGGDPYCGDCAIDQFALWRPFSGARGHATGVARLWHIGASTHPGPGLGGGSGFLVAHAINGS